MTASQEGSGAAPFDEQGLDDIAGGASDGVSSLHQMMGFAELDGQMIGHYRVQEKLGGGAMASVYRATDQILERTVALKVLLPGADESTRERFRLEARTVSTLDHPNIVPTFQVGQTAADGITYIAMEMVQGGTLGDLLTRVDKLSVEDASKLLAPIAGALAYAHANGIVHRDVKPGNILLKQVNA
ncbi:MAG: serine/threonine protein kinase, partial [Caldilineaceae bacterium]|nr:serine/threonine protein kinase [Caldilineaceae bacterium]